MRVKNQIHFTTFYTIDWYLAAEWEQSYHLNISTTLWLSIQPCQIDKFYLWTASWRHNKLWGHDYFLFRRTLCYYVWPKVILTTDKFATDPKDKCKNKMIETKCFFKCSDDSYLETVIQINWKLLCLSLV